TWREERGARSIDQMSEQLVAEAYEARKQQEIDWLRQPVAAGSGPTPDDQGAPAPEQPTSSLQPRTEDGVIASVGRGLAAIPSQLGRGVGRIAGAVNPMAESPTLAGSHIAGRGLELLKGVGDILAPLQDAGGKVLGDFSTWLRSHTGQLTDDQ